MLTNTDPKVFFIFWLSLTAALLGIVSANFALGLWVYNNTGSLSQFTLIGISALLPAILLMPKAGTIVDRIKPRKAIMTSSIVMALCWGLFSFIFYFDAFNIFLILFPLIVIGVFSSLQTPAYSSVVAQLVSKTNLDKANGFFGLGVSIATIAGPIIGGVLLKYYSIWIIFLLPVAALILQSLVLSLVKLPSEKEESSEQNLKVNIKEVFLFVKTNSDLKFIFFLGLVLNSIAELAGLIVIPLGLTYMDEMSVGLFVTLGALGGLIGQAILSAFGGFDDKIRAILIINIIQGLVLITVSQFEPGLLVLSVALFIFMLFESFSDNADITFWQERAPESMRASVLSFKAMASLMASLIAYIVAAPFVDIVFAPIAEGGVDVGSSMIPDDKFLILLLILGCLNVLVCTVVLTKYVRKFLKSSI